MKKVRAKFVVQSIELHHGGAKLSAAVVYAGSEENDKFFAATPSGALELDVLKPEILESFRPGVEFYADLELAG